MRISSIGYTIKQGFRNIWRNKMFSLASIATMSACIFLVRLILFYRDELSGNGKRSRIRCGDHCIL